MLYTKNLNKLLYFIYFPNRVSSTGCVIDDDIIMEVKQVKNNNRIQSTTSMVLLILRWEGSMAGHLYIFLHCPHTVHTVLNIFPTPSVSYLLQIKIIRTLHPSFSNLVNGGALWSLHPIPHPVTVHWSESYGTRGEEGMRS